MFLINCRRLACEAVTTFMRINRDGALRQELMGGSNVTIFINGPT